jgi:hypothetical protein
VRLTFVLAEVLYVVNGLDRIVRLLVENRLFEWSRTKQANKTNKHASVQDIIKIIFINSI